MLPKIIYRDEIYFRNNNMCEGSVSTEWEFDYFFHCDGHLLLRIYWWLTAALFLFLFLSTDLVYLRALLPS